MNTPRPDQTNPENVTSGNVQFWSNGVMRTAQMTRETAREMVASGEAFVISAQAVGALQNGQRNS